jgi:hypothetical protein
MFERSFGEATPKSESIRDCTKTFHHEGVLFWRSLYCMASKGSRCDFCLERARKARLRGSDGKIGTDLRPREAKISR